MESAAPRAGWLARIRQSLARTREALGRPVADILRADGADRAATLAELGRSLVAADVGANVAADAVAALGAREACVSDDLALALRDELVAQLTRLERPPASPEARPRVVFLVGVNGTGKTTTLGKLAARLAAEGERPLLVAADTFRAAAIEQLAAWADRARVPLVRQAPGADPAAVLHDGLQRAKERGESPVLVDTAGRLHVKSHLMEELAKMARVAGRLVPGAPHECLLVMDATTGQNGLAQAREFGRAVPLTGLVLTKLDGTAKGGIALAIAREMALPVLHVGVGEGASDLAPFDATAYVEGLLGLDPA